MTKLLSLRLPIGNELAERHEAAVHPARPIVQFERVDAAQLASRRPEDQDIVIVERFGTAFGPVDPQRSEEHTSELQSLMRISYAVFCLQQKIHKTLIKHYIYRAH